MCVVCFICVAVFEAEGRIRHLSEADSREGRNVCPGMMQTVMCVYGPPR